MATPYEKVVVVGGAGGSGTPTVVQVDVTSGPVEVEVVNDQPIEVKITEIADNTIFNVDTRGTLNYFVDADGNPLPIKTAFGAPASSGQNTLIAGVASKKIRVVGYQLQGTGTVNAKFRSGASTDISMLWNFQAREGVLAPLASNGFYFETTAGAALTINLSDAVGVNVQVQYIEV